jgi:hypothetical protein
MSAKQEQIWIDAWNDLYDLLKDKDNIKLLLPDWSEVSLDEMQGWIQQTAYENKLVRFDRVWYKGQKALQVITQE